MDGQLLLHNGGVRIHHNLGGLLRQRHHRLAGPHLDGPLKSWRKLTGITTTTLRKPEFGGPAMTIELVCPRKMVESGKPELKKNKNKRKRGAYAEEKETPRQWPNGHGWGGGEAMPVRNGAP